MKGRTNVFTQEQNKNIKVENFIYHIIKSDQDEPDYLDEVKLSTKSQRDFFKRIISETGQGTQYTFINPKNSPLINICKDIISNPKKDFYEKSKALASNFLSYHSDGRTSDGILIIARTSTIVSGTRKSFIALVKLDYTPVMRQRRTGSRNKTVELEEIVDALSEQSSAIQKRALIDVSNIFSWDVLAVERHKAGKLYDTEDATSDYFKNFLGVRLKKNDSSYTKEFVKHAYRWAKQYDGDLDGRTATDIRHACIKLMDAFENSNIKYDDIKNSLCAHNNPIEIKKLHDSFDTYMSDNGLAGISFSPKPKSIGNTTRQGEWETDSGIKIIWKGERNPNTLKKESTPDGSTVITIIANEVVEREL